MAAKRLQISGKPVRLHGSLVAPDFTTPRVLCSDPWGYVSLWLKRHHQEDALFFWEQAKHFFDASKALPALSSPLTSYYCFLNAAKALLKAKSQTFSDAHGMTGSTKAGHASLANETVLLKGAGILPALCAYLGEPDNAGKSVTLKEMFWELPFIHRAYTLTYSGTTELFVPLSDICFVRKNGSQESYFQAEVGGNYVRALKQSIPSGFQIFENQGRNFIRRKKCFKWSERNHAQSLKNLLAYHAAIRPKFSPIYSSENRWYVRKAVAGHDRLGNSQLVIILAAMHRLSELSRYDPVALSKHFGVNHNWLLTEFIEKSPGQFSYAIASEITGLEFVRPDSF